MNGFIGSLEIVDTGCPTCDEVVTIGTTTPTACPYLAGSGGVWPGTTATNLTFTLVAPATPGVYYVHLAIGQQFFCPQTEAQFAAVFANDTARRIGTITVR